MPAETHRIPDVLPGEAVDFEGAFGFEGSLTVRPDDVGDRADLRRAQYSLRSRFGHAEYTLLGRDRYYAEWGSFVFRRGLSYTASIDQPVVGLVLQLDGRLHAGQNPLGLDFEMRAGDANLAVLPPVTGSFDTLESCRGTTFTIMLSRRYFTGLCERYPRFLEHLLERMRRQEPALLAEQRHLRVTPAMWGVTQRVRRHDARTGAGALFLEAQILELLALQLDQLDRPVPENGGSLSRADAERIRAARDLLLARMHDPPSLSELARHTLLNEFKLKRGFREIFGTSPYAYLLQHRLELARAHLLDTDLSVAEIARRVGYSDSAHLTHAFRKHYGIRPSDLR